MASFKFKNVYLSDNYCIVGPLEANSNLKKYDLKISDYYFDEETFEAAEVKMQRVVIDYLLRKNKKIDVICGGELSNQLAITSIMTSNYPISFIGMYSACSTFNLSLIQLASLIDSKKIKKGIAITSSHNKVAERQFRYPIEYGAPRPKRSTYTATGALGVIVQSEKTNIKIESATIGNTVDYGIKDVFNMGAVMAPSAVSTLYNHLNDLKRDINYYDIILTGDLGIYGAMIFKEMMKNNYNIDVKKYIDAGSILYKKEQELNAGASGPITLPLVLFNNILTNKKYKKILVIATGSLHSPVLVNQHNTIPSIAHAISLEVL